MHDTTGCIHRIGCPEGSWVPGALLEYCMLWKVGICMSVATIWWTSIRLGRRPLSTDLLLWRNIDSSESWQTPVDDAGYSTMMQSKFSVWRRRSITSAYWFASLVKQSLHCNLLKGKNKIRDWTPNSTKSQVTLDRMNAIYICIINWYAVSRFGKRSSNATNLSYTILRTGCQSLQCYFIPTSTTISCYSSDTPKVYPMCSTQQTQISKQ